MTRCLCEYCPPVAAYLVTILAAPGLLAIVLSVIDRRRDIRRMSRIRRTA